MVLYMAAYLFMNLGAFACILFSLRTGSDRISDYAGLYQKDPLITLGLSLCLLSLGGIPPMLGFFGKIYLFFAAGLISSTSSWWSVCSPLWSRSTTTSR